MAKNKILFDALSNLTFLASQDAEKRNNALDELLKAEPAQFRAAIMAHGDFWNAAIPDLTKDDRLVAAGRGAYTESEQFLAENDPIYSFKRLRQLAIEQRVKLGLKNAEDTVLIEILKNNEAETRAYLADKRPEFDFLKNAAGWVPTPVPPAPVPPAQPETPKNASTDVLTDDAVRAIRKAALNQLLLDKILKTQDSELLKNVLDAPDLASLKTATAALGFPQGAQPFLSIPLSPEVLKEAKALESKLSQNDAAAQFPEYVNSLDDSAVLAYRAALESNDINDFKNQLPEPYHSHLIDQVAAKDLMANRYLQALFATTNRPPVELLPLMNAADESALKVEIEKVVGNHAYINTAVTKDNMEAIKRNVLRAFIANLGNDAMDKLKALEAAEPFAPFKAALNKLDITNTEWINSSDMGAVKQAARTQMFILNLKAASPFDLSAHRHLIDAFNHLSVTKQRELLKNPADLNNILRAKEVNQIQGYFGGGTDAAGHIIDENNALEQFKKIHNSEVAKVLANLKPVIILDEAKVAAINQAFLVVPPVVPPAAPVPPEPVNLDAPNAFRQLKAAIISAATGGANPAIASQFDAAEAEIKNQHRHNRLLFQAYAQKESQTERAIYSLYLGAAKQAELDGVMDHLVKPRKGIEEPVFNRLKGELTPLISARENEQTAEDLENGVDIPTILTRLNGSLAVIRKTHQSLTANLDEMKQIAAIKNTQLLNPAFQGKEKSQSVELLDHYKELAEACDLTVDQLRRQKTQLEGYAQSIPRNVGGTDQEKEEVYELRYLMQMELKSLNKNLALYEQAQAKLYGDQSQNNQGILDVLENAAQGKSNYIYKNLSSYILGNEAAKVAAEQIAGLEIHVGADNTNKLPFTLSEGLEPGQVRVYEFEHKIETIATTTSPATPVEYKGQFTEEHFVSPAQEHSGVFKVKEAPKQPQIRANLSQQEKERLKNELESAKVQFYLDLAVQALARMDGKPSKDNKIRLAAKDPEMLKYSYAAFITLGVDEKAIKVRSKQFDPEKEKGMLWGYVNDSAINVFKGKAHEAAVKNSKKDLEKIMELKSDKSGAREFADNLATDATRLFKSENAAIIEKAKATMKEEGPAPSSKPKL